MASDLDDFVNCKLFPLRFQFDPVTVAGTSFKMGKIATVLFCDGESCGAEFFRAPYDGGRAELVSDGMVEFEFATIEDRPFV